MLKTVGRGGSSISQFSLLLMGLLWMSFCPFVLAANIDFVAANTINDDITRGDDTDVKTVDADEEDKSRSILAKLGSNLAIPTALVGVLLFSVIVSSGGFVAVLSIL